MQRNELEKMYRAGHSFNAFCRFFHREDYEQYKNKMQNFEKTSKEHESYIRSNTNNILISFSPK